MKRFVFATVLLASVVAPLAIARRAQVRLQERRGVLDEQSARLAELAASNEGLKNQLGGAGAGLTREQRSEILKLRNEIGQLRRAVEEADELRSKSARLLAARDHPNSGLASNAPDPATVQAHWPKAQLGSAGYADLLSALQSAFWAMSRGEPDSLAGSLTREALRRLTREGWNDRKSPEEELAASAREISVSLGPATGFSVTTQKTVADDFAIIAVYFEGEGQTRRVAMKKVGGEWKLSMMGLAGDNDGDIQEGYVAWP
jgi:hypothetical protein